VTRAAFIAESFLPLGQLAWELILGLGLAFAGGNLWALVRPGYVERRTGKRQPRPPDPPRVKRNIAIGVAVAAVGLVGLIGSLGGG
jgi:hypothetical protein